MHMRWHSFRDPGAAVVRLNYPIRRWPDWSGFRHTIGLDLDLVIPNPGLTLGEGAIEPWTKPQYDWAAKELRHFCKSQRIALNIPFNQLPRQQRNAIIIGKGEWSGVRGFFAWIDTKKSKLHVRDS